MPKIDLYTAHSIDRSATCDDLAQQLTSQLESVDQYDLANRGRVETARAILSDPQRRASYDGLLTAPASHIDEQVLASIASGASSAPTQPPTGYQPTPGAYLPAPVQQPYPPVQQSQYPRAGQPQQQRIVHVVVVPDGLMPTTDYWADSWTVEMSPDGSAIRLVGTGKGAAARKAAKTSRSHRAEATGGAVGGGLGLFF